jgi:ectoine hydroxylase-related dioxygenase (phytanoyl-CoA dioxygenase family)
MNDAPHALNADETRRFHVDGYLGPFDLLSPDEMHGVNERLHANVFQTDGPNPGDRTHCRHLDTRLVYDLVAHPAVVRRIASLFGEDVMCWTSGFFIKQPGKGLETPWHQDINYWPLEPQVNLTAWVATEDVGMENAPLRVIPGTQRRTVPHVRTTAGKAFGEEADPAAVDEAKAVHLPMRAGQFVIFSERLLHGAPANTSARRRTALAVRYTLPQVRLFPDEPPINFPRHRALIVSGRDRFGFNRFGEPPTA